MPETGLALGKQLSTRKAISCNTSVTFVRRFLNMFEKTKFGRWTRYVFVELADPRTNSWPLVENPLPVLVIVVLWSFFVLSWGPKFMANRKPFKLQKLMVVYNVIQVMISLALVYPGLRYCYFFGSYSFSCEPVDRSRRPVPMKVARVVYWYYLAKITELLDTVFFVLRKKDKQVSFLHVYHHGGMPLVGWALTKYFPGGHIIFGGLLNSIVHTVMYTYYMISAMGPKYQKYLWWKKHITSMQLVQFALAFVHFSQLLWTDCGFPRWIILFAMPNAVFFYVMFSEFYQKAYKQKQEREIEARKLLTNGTNDQIIKEKVQ